MTELRNYGEALPQLVLSINFLLPFLMKLFFPFKDHNFLFQLHDSFLEVNHSFTFVLFGVIYNHKIKLVQTNYKLNIDFICKISINEALFMRSIFKWSTHLNLTFL